MLDETVTTSRRSAIMLNRGSVVLTLVLVGACGGAQSNVCANGRTLLDGVCVREEVADYVACVRAQGARLSDDRNRKLSADVGFAGTKAGAATEVQDKLQREYTAADANVLEVIKTCGTIQRGSTTAAATDSSATNVAGDWTTSFQNGESVESTTIRLVQDGVHVTGTYWNGGRYDGTLKGRRFEGAWWLGTGSGRVEWTFSADGKTFEGKWGGSGGDLPFWQRGSRL